MLERRTAVLVAAMMIAGCTSDGSDASDASDSGAPDGETLDSMSGECDPEEGCDAAAECEGEIDCMGVCEGDAIVDCEGVCGGDAVVDCEGVCGGDAVEDCEGFCGGDAVVDCMGVCGGDAVVDCEDVCGGDAVEDCMGVCGGDAVEDCMGVCGGTALVDCEGICDGGVTEDCDGVCGGSAVEDCDGVCNGSAEEDCAGVCNGTAELDCDGVCNGTAVVDCQGVCDGTAVVDCTGECGGSAERDCEGVCNGTAELDCSDTCNGTDEGPAHYADLDGDGLGDSATLQRTCAVPAGRVTTGGDCDDAVFGCTDDCSACLSDGLFGTGLTFGASDLPVSFPDGTRLGMHVEPIGDVDGNGVPDLAVLTGASPPELWLVLLGDAGGITSAAQVVAGVGGAPVDFALSSLSKLAWIGNYGSESWLAVSNPSMYPEDSSFSGPPEGTLWVLRIDDSGSVSASAEHASPFLTIGCYWDGRYINFGLGLAATSDLNDDGIPDLAVATGNDCASLVGGGRVDIHLLAADGSLASRVSHGTETLNVATSSTFGDSAVGLGDLDGNGYGDIAIGEPPRNASEHGVIRVLLLGSGGVLVDQVQLARANMEVPTGESETLGRSLGFLGDVDGDGRPELTSGDLSSHGFWVLSLNTDGSLHRIRLMGGPEGRYLPAETGGGPWQMRRLGDYDSDGVADFVVGQPDAAGGGVARGALAILSPSALCGTPSERDCNGDRSDGCETDVTSDTQCGECGRSCLGRPHSSGGSCESSACVLTCDEGYADCDGLPENGCELDVRPGSYANVTAVDCVAGSPSLACSGDWANCNGILADGCEIDTRTDAAHCGACENACLPVQGYEPTCDGLTCGTTGACAPQTLDCDGEAANGCETCRSPTGPHHHLEADELTPAQRAEECAAGAECEEGQFCVMETMSLGDRSSPRNQVVPVCRLPADCELGTGECDGDPATVCEADLTTELSCGGCQQYCGLWYWNSYCVLNDTLSEYYCSGG